MDEQDAQDQSVHGGKVSMCHGHLGHVFDLRTARARAWKPVAPENDPVREHVFSHPVHPVHPC